MRKLYKMELRFRSGTLFGMFVSTDDDVQRLYEKTMHFGEVLGKHSDVRVDLTDGDIVTVTDDQEFINKYIQLIGDVGLNPFDCLLKDDNNDDEE